MGILEIVPFCTCRLSLEANGPLATSPWLGNQDIIAHRGSSPLESLGSFPLIRVAPRTEWKSPRTSADVLKKVLFFFFFFFSFRDLVDWAMTPQTRTAMQLNRTRLASARGSLELRRLRHSLGAVEKVEKFFLCLYQG